MKKLSFLLCSLMLYFSSFSQAVYIPSKGSVTAKPIAPSAGVPTDARSYFYDSLNFRWRPYLSTAEVTSFLNSQSLRRGNFPIIVNTGGTLLNGVVTGGTNEEYWFKDGLTNNDLVMKSSIWVGSVAQLRLQSTKKGQTYITTDFETQFWQDIGLSDGIYTDDSVSHIITNGGRVLERSRANILSIKSFGVAGNGVTDDRAAVQKAVDFAENHSLKSLLWEGDVVLGDSVLFRRGGVALIGTGVLLREESWLSLNANFSRNNPFRGSSVIVANNKRGFVFDTTVVDPIDISKIQFIKNGGRTTGTTTGILFKSTRQEPTWPLRINDCNFRGFNYAIKMESRIQYLAAFVEIRGNAFSQNDECLYFGDIPQADVTSIGQRNVVWGFVFEHNKCHDNARVIRASVSFDGAYIGFNNAEGNIAYSNGTYPEALFDIEFSKTTVKIEGNHFEGVTNVKECIKISSQFKFSNGLFMPLQGTTQNSSENRVHISGGNSFNGVNSNVSPIEATGCHVYNEDPYYVRGSAIYYDNNKNQTNNLLMANDAKAAGSTFKFDINTTENYSIHPNDLAWLNSISYNAGSRAFLTNTPLGQRQVVNTANGKPSVILQSYGGMDYSNNVNFFGVTYLVNSPFKSEFFGNILFYYTYTDSAGVVVSGTFETKNNLYGVPLGWSYLTAYFPNIFPKNSTARGGYFGLPTAELIGESLLVGTDFTVFGVKNSDPTVTPYYSYERATYKVGTFQTGQSFTDEENVMNVVKSGGTAGSLSGVTATGNLFGRYMLVNDASSLLPGQSLSILGYTYKISNINLDTVFISSQLNDDLANAPVAFKQPSFDIYITRTALTDSLNARGGAAFDYNSVILNRAPLQTSKGFYIDGIARAGLLWSDNDIIGQNLTLNNWLLYNGGQPNKIFFRDNNNARMHMELIGAGTAFDAYTAFHSSVVVDGKLDVAGKVTAAAATNPNEAVILSQLNRSLTDSLDSRFNKTSFTLRSANGTGYSLFTSPSANSGLLKNFNVGGVGVSVTVNNDSTLNFRVGVSSQTVTSAASVTPDANFDNGVKILAQSVPLTIANPIGSPQTFQELIIRIRDNGNAQPITWGSDFRPIGVTLPTTTVAGQLLYVKAIANLDEGVGVTKWDIYEIHQQGAVQTP